MANGNTYTWRFPAIDVYTQQGSYSDVVYNIHWRLSATTESGSYSAENYGVQSVAPYNPDSGSFIPYENLTKELVTSWILDSMGEKYGILTASLDNQIEIQINPPTLQLSPPWSDIPPTPEPTPQPTFPPMPTITFVPSMTPTPTPTPEPTPNS